MFKNRPLSTSFAKQFLNLKRRDLFSSFSTKKQKKKNKVLIVCHTLNGNKTKKALYGATKSLKKIIGT